MPESDDNLPLEIRHVLFIDIVGYSKLLNEEQKERLNQLREIVLGTAQVRDSTDEQLVRLPTGDGMALVFRHSAEEPARCALEIAEALQKHPEQEKQAHHPIHFHLAKLVDRPDLLAKTFGVHHGIASSAHNSKLGKLNPAPLRCGIMKLTRRQLFSCLTALILSLGGLSHAAENESRMLATSPSGDWRVELKGEEFWIVSTKNVAEEEKLPVESAERAPVEFYFSPDEKWIFTLPDGGSCIRPGDLFHRNADGAIDSIASFDTKAWAQAVSLGAFANDPAAEGACAMMRFIGWSLDSGRLLVGLRGGHGKTEMDAAYLYFNTRTKSFQITPYLRKLNKVSSDILSSSDDVLPCAEPASPMPSAKDLKARFDQRDRQLNEKYADIMRQTPAEQVVLLRLTQKDWIRHRDEGLKLYLSLYPKAEKEARRLQFLGDVTAARIQLAPVRWGSPETWLY